MVDLGVLPGATGSEALALTSNGNMIIGNSGSEAFRWTPIGMTGLGFLPATTSSEAEWMSADGSVVVGMSGSEAFRWTLPTGMVGLGFLSGAPPGANSIAYSVSDAGNIIVGSSSSEAGQQAFRWTPTGGMEGLGFLPGGSYSEADDINPDGTVIFGESDSAIGNQVFYWTQAEGMVGLGLLPGTTASLFNQASNDGNVIIGSGLTGNGEVGFLWDKENGLLDFKEMLMQAPYFFDLTAWDWLVPENMSSDGKIIGGYGYNKDLGTVEAFRVDLHLSSIPLPGTLSLMLAGLIGLVVLAFRTMVTAGTTGAIVCKS